MKHKKWRIICAVLAVMFTLSVPSCFREDFLTGVFGLLFAAAAWVLFFVLRDKRRQPDAASRPAAPVQHKRARSVDEYLTFDNDLDQIPRVDFDMLPAPVSSGAVKYIPQVRYSSVSARSVVKNMFPLVVVDTETTGLDGHSKIVEVSAIKFSEGFVPVSCFTTLINPGCRIPGEAVAVHGITDDMVAGAPRFSQIAGAFSDYIAGHNVLGHNLPFDLKFLVAEGVKLCDNVRYYDSLAIAKNTLVASYYRDWASADRGRVAEYDVENMKLETLCEYYGIKRSGAHRSLSDCFATAKVFENLIIDIKSEK